jgi:hypothetical protein
MQRGSDTCIIQSESINVGDIFNIGIRCDNPCTFDLSTNYISVVPITESSRA